MYSAQRPGSSADIGLELDIVRAIERDEFTVVFQPTLDIRTREMIGMEALVRWDHPTRGRLLPAEFLALAEENGTIVEIGKRVLLEACKRAAALARHQLRFTLAVNVSARQLDSQRLVHDVREALEETGLAAEALVLEITETASFRDLDVVVGQLTALRRLGVRIAIDDFGTGYSSLDHLRRCPIDILKIDRSFVAELQTSLASAAIVHVLLELGRILHIDIVAEGVECETQLQFLESEGCTMAQGHFFAEALEWEQLTQFLLETRRRAATTWLPRLMPDSPAQMPPLLRSKP